MKKETEKIEIPFGAKDSVLNKFEYTIPEGYEAEIKDGKVIVKKKESEDERIRKEIVYFICWAIDRCSITNEQRGRSDSWLAYLEKLKEQKSAELSEKDEALIENVCTALKGYALHERKVDLDEHAHRLEEMSERLKSLRPQSHWKPSEEQMEALKDVIDRALLTCRQQVPLESLYNDLKKLM